LIAVGLVLAAVGVFLFYGSRRKGANDTVDAEDARPVVALLVCSTCGKRLSARPSQFGKAVRCPSCGTRLKVPESTGSDVEIV
jgi:DNA-directed RNA polymerase subunit RPC12/RpoP